jgi:hypothetical protein
VFRLGTRGSDFTLVVKIISSRRSCVQPVNIAAVVNLPQIVKIPERQRYLRWSPEWIGSRQTGISSKGPSGLLVIRSIALPNARPCNRRRLRIFGRAVTGGQ